MAAGHRHIAETCNFEYAAGHELENDETSLRFSTQKLRGTPEPEGVGPAMVRGLALIAELVYGEKASWEKPVKYSFAYGGKDGVPFPVNRRAMDDSITMLRDTVKASRIDDKEKLNSLQALRRFVPQNPKS